LLPPLFCNSLRLTSSLAGSFRRDTLLLGNLRSFFCSFFFFLRGLLARDGALFALDRVVLLFDRISARDVGSFLLFQRLVARNVSFVSRGISFVPRVECKHAESGGD
jgi:hypothetical protein